MLYISRRIGESILIDGKIEIILSQISGKQIKLGILAPRNTSVYRKELLEKILYENKMAYEAANNLLTSENPSNHISLQISQLNSLLHKMTQDIKKGETININSVFKIMTDLEPIIKEAKNSNIQTMLKLVMANYQNLLSELHAKQKNLIDELTNLNNNIKSFSIVE